MAPTQEDKRITADILIAALSSKAADNLLGAGKQNLEELWARIMAMVTRK